MDIFQDVNLLQLETRIIISWTFSDYTIIFFTKRFHFCSLISESEWLPYVKYTFLSVLNSICYKKAKKKKMNNRIYMLQALHPGHETGPLNSL